MKDIKTVTVYSDKQVKKFLEVYYFDKLKIVRVILNIMIFIIIVYFFTRENPTYNDIFSFVIATLGLLELNTTILPRFNYYKMKKRKDNPIGIKIEYEFKENYFTLLTNKKENIRYSNLKQVISTDSAYYLYIDKTMAFIVDKTILSADEVEILNKIFASEAPVFKEKK